ncbi:IclR family transcriptional regulator [Aureimonas sp. D3]|uniref:IclR family transcriptional regulator n=1 Tax=Aureimonas sp. D3 TaxID=1638164 RepID=UPI001FCCF1BC|nr:IclR family transcriptional regulator [Aureimonas sp. D3]
MNYTEEKMTMSREAPTSQIEGRTEENVPALRRAFQILDLVAGSDGSLNAAEITRGLSLPKSTVHGLLKVMVELNVLVKSSNGSFKLGPHLMRWAHGFLAEVDVVSAFQEFFAVDTALSQYTITLAVLDGDHVVYIGCRNSNQPLGLTFRIGMRLPAPFTATGKMLLSQLPDADLVEMLDGRFPAPMTTQSVSSLDELRKELQIIRQRGYSIDDGEVRAGIICIGSVIRDHSGKVIAGIATSLLRSDSTQDIIEELGARMISIAGRLSQRMGVAAGPDRPAA